MNDVQVQTLLLTQKWVEFASCLALVCHDARVRFVFEQSKSIDEMTKQFETLKYQ